MKGKKLVVQYISRHSLKPSFLGPGFLEQEAQAQEAPPLRKSWKVRGLGNDNKVDTLLRCFRAAELVMIRRNPGYRALTGHKAEAPKEGISRVLVLTRSCKVFDHLRTMTALESEKMTSAAHTCLVLSKVLAV